MQSLFDRSWTGGLTCLILHSLPVSVSYGDLLGALVGWLAGLRHTDVLAREV